MARRGSCTAVGHGRRSEHGQSVVEMAIILPILLLVVMGLFDLGRVVYAQHTLTQAVREAARLGAVGAQMTAAKYSAIRAEVRETAVMTTPVAADIMGEAGACTAGVADPTVPTACFYPDGLGTGNRLVINASARVDLFTPLVASLVGGSFSVSANIVEFLP